MAKTYNARKRKVKKNVPHGEVHIHTTFNNTVITITDTEGNTISWAPNRARLLLYIGG